ncbi:MAG: phosphodiester glycosidase family protein [Acutalibacteraceae bacterium]
MINVGDEEFVDVESFAEGLSETHPDRKRKLEIKEEKEALKYQKLAEKEQKKTQKELKKHSAEEFENTSEATEASVQNSVAGKPTKEELKEKFETVSLDVALPEEYDLDYIESVDTEKETEELHEKNSKKKRKKKSKENKLNKGVLALLILSVCILLGVSGYVTVVFGNIPFVTKWRNIWIETAMTTDQHKWLATSFFPEWLIDEVMSKQVDIKDISVTDLNGAKDDDILGQKNLVVGEKDSHGNVVYANDIEEGIVILEVQSSNYKGKLVLIDDSSRVFISATDYKGSRGEFICDYLEKENAVIGVNASGFNDPGGVGMGGTVTGQCVAQGEYWGTYNSMYTLVGLDTNDRLVVGGIDNWENYNIRDGFQYRPSLIIDGVKVVEDSAGWGLQPRTVVGQAENGVFMFLVMDGRQVGYSLGATMEDCADILLEYGAVTAGACDGGSSSVIGYKGEIINKPSTNMPTGRYLPNAWLVRSKSAE